MKQHIHTVIWDLGGVLIDWNPDYVFRQVFPDPAERKWFFDHICTHEWNLEQDRGRSLQEATELKVAEWPDFEDAIRAYYGRWTEMLGGSIDPNVEILSKLSANPGYRILALTNWSHETFPVALQRYEFLGWFEGIVMSGEEGVIKPEREIYERLLQRYSVAPETAVFIDDNQVNISGAEALGLAGIHYTPQVNLHTALQSLGIQT